MPGQSGAQRAFTASEHRFSRLGPYLGHGGRACTLVEVNPMGLDIEGV